MLDDLLDAALANHAGSPYIKATRLRAPERRAAWARAAALALEDGLNELSLACSLVDSPLEELFLCELWVTRGWGYTQVRVLRDGDTQGRSPAWPPGRVGELVVQAQAPVGPYRCDFALSMREFFQSVRFEALVVVEIDGHDFHEKTKKQAAHDKKRDRYFAEQGLTVLRFTGSEVHRSPAACVGQALQILCKKMRDAAP